MRGLRKCIELGDHLPSRLPEERYVPFRVFLPNIINECANIVVKALLLDMFELSRRLILGQGRSLGCNNLLKDPGQLPLCIVNLSLQPRDLHQGVLLILQRCLLKFSQLGLNCPQLRTGSFQLSPLSLRMLPSFLPELLVCSEFLFHGKIEVLL